MAKVARRLAWEAFGSGATGLLFLGGAVAVGWFFFAKGGTFS